MTNKNVYENEFAIHIENVKLHIHSENHRDCDFEFSPTAFEHKHVFSEIFLCGEGCIEISVEKSASECENVKVPAGDIVIIPPGIVHTVIGGNEGSSWFVINFLCEQTDVYDSEDLYSKLSVLYKAGDIIHMHDKREFYTMAESIICSEDMVDSIIGAMRFAELLLKLSGKYTNENVGADSSVIMHKNSSLQNYKKLDKLINGYFRYENAEELISEEMFISTRQLDRIAKRQYGMTLHQIITENRVKYAEKCLSVTDMSVEKLAAFVGFSSRASFYRAFEAKYGCTPVEYRRKTEVRS